MHTSTPTISEPGLPQAAEVDVLLLLEGTFPYVAGGVSSWVNQIIRGFPQLRFGAVFMGSRPEDYAGLRYALPDNLVHLQTTYLFTPTEQPPIKAERMDAEVLARVEQMHDLFASDHRNPACQQLVTGLLDAACKDGGLSQESFLFSEEAWSFIKKCYRSRSFDPSFVDYFWSVRNMHTPFWQLRDVAAQCPPARLYHSVSTGYAGVLGVLLKHRQKRPFILSEHGIYVKERKIDLYQAQWLKDNRSVFDHDPSRISYFRELWIRFFEHLGYATYQSADDITALYESNRQRQLKAGAPPERSICLPNGINVERFAPLRAQRVAKPAPVLCLIGRVVPIKDVKTFIRAMRIVANRLPAAKGWIAGPEDESPEYARECRALVLQLGLQDTVLFLGFRKLEELLPSVDLTVLSSISEAQPLVILEGYAAGIPTVVTDVGACREMVFGAPGDDAALGNSGRVVRIADPLALADAAIELLADTQEWHRASQAAVQRVETYYSQRHMLARIAALYDKNLQWQE